MSRGCVSGSHALSLCADPVGEVLAAFSVVVVHGVRAVALVCVQGCADVLPGEAEGAFRGRPFKCCLSTKRVQKNGLENQGMVIERGNCRKNLRARVSALRVILSKVDRDAPENREIETIEPDNRILALVAMVMPIPWRCEDHVSSLHPDFLTLDGCEAIIAFDDEPQRECGVSVCRSCLARQDELEATVNCVGGVGSICCGVLMVLILRNTNTEERGFDIRIFEFTSMSTRLSASSAPTIFPASIKDGRSSLYLHTVGTAFGFG